MELRQIAPGVRFQRVVRPLGARSALPFRISFEHADLVEVRGDERHQVAVHQHPHYEIIVVLDGVYGCRINGSDVTMSAGGLVVLKPDDHHEDTASGDLRFAALEIRVLPGATPQRSAMLFTAGIAPADQAIRTPAGPFADLALRMVAEAGRVDAFTGHVLDTLAAEAVWMLVRSMPREVIDPQLLTGADEHEFGNRLHQLFDERLGEQLGLREMARALGLSERTLTARCRAAFATSPTRLFVRHQMAAARTLLIHTALPIKDISAYLGFENPYHFSTVYKRVYGVAPTRARE